jgi:glycosyltransferase involved in cell wall biosynthesis
MEFAAWDLARALVDSGLDVALLTTRIEGRADLFIEDGVSVVPLGEAAPGMYSRDFWRTSGEWFRRNAGRVGAVLSVSAGAYGLLSERPRQPDVRFILQAHGTAVGEIHAKLSTASPVLWLRSVRNIASLPRDLRAYPRFDRVVAVGPAVARQLTALPLSRVLPPEGVTVIENGIDTRRFRKDPSAGAEVRASLGWDADDLVVATVSRMHRQKGVGEALRGFTEYARRRADKEPRVRWLVVGDGPVREAIEAEASRLLPPDAYRFVGGVMRSRVADFYNAADVFLFTTRHLEGLPLNVLEAAATGLPLVLSRTLRDGLDLPGPAWYVDPTAPDQVAGALDEAVEGIADASAVPEQGVSKLPDRYTLTRSAALYAEVLFPGATQ